MNGKLAEQVAEGTVMERHGVVVNFYFHARGPVSNLSQEITCFVQAIS
jgi:hypothetical protein